MRLLGTLEVEKTDKILCDHEGCQRPVFKKIHVIDDAGHVRLIGSTCYLKTYKGTVDESRAWISGGNGERLTDEERQRFKENTETLRQIYEQRYENFLKAEKARALLQEKIEKEKAAIRAEQQAMATLPPVQPAKETQDWKKWARDQLYAKSQPINPRILPADEWMLDERELLAHAYAMERQAFRAKGLDPDTPGFVGLVKANTTCRFEAMRQAIEEGRANWRDLH